MIKTISRIALVCGLGVLMAGAAFAGPQTAKMKPGATKPVVCPFCHMPLSMKKDKARPVAVRLKKGAKIMYCCAGCKMPASVLVKTKKKMATK